MSEYDSNDDTHADNRRSNTASTTLEVSVTRRQLLSVASGGIATVGGCFSADETRTSGPSRGSLDSSGETDESEETVVTGTPNQEVREAINGAQGELSAGFDHLNAVGIVTDDGGFDPRGLTEFEPGQVFLRVEEAKSNLETAKTEPDATVAAEKIHVFEGVVSVLDATIRLHVEIDTTLKQTAVYFKNTGYDYALAVEHIRKARESLDRWSNVNSDLQDALSIVGNSPVAPGVGSFDYQRWRTLAQYAAGIPVALSPALAGFEHRGEAKVAQRDGSRAWNDEQWETAEEQYDAALANLRKAKGKFDEAVQEDLVLYRKYVTTYICRDPGHRDAYLTLGEAALAMQHDKTDEGERLHEEGRDKLAESISECPLSE